MKKCQHDAIDLLALVDDDVFIKAAYPTMTHMIITMQGGQAGTASDGTVGKPGKLISIAVSAANCPEAINVIAGRGGRGAPGQPDGAPGSVLIEIYECGCGVSR